MTWQVSQPPSLKPFRPSAKPPKRQKQMRSTLLSQTHLEKPRLRSKTARSRTRCWSLHSRSLHCRCSKPRVRTRRTRLLRNRRSWILILRWMRRRLDRLVRVLTLLDRWKWSRVCVTKTQDATRTRVNSWLFCLVNAEQSKAEPLEGSPC